MLSKTKTLILALIISLSGYFVYLKYYKDYDLTVIGSINPRDGIGSQSINLINMMDKYYDINFIKSKKHIKLAEVPLSVLKTAIISSYKPAKVVIYEDALPYYLPKTIHSDYHKIKALNQAFSFDGKKNSIFFAPNDTVNINMVKNHPKRRNHFYIAYSMFESDRILSSWVKILNNYFDMVLVPSEFLVNVYRQSGVKIPIHYMPLGINLNDELSSLITKRKSKSFIFGNLSAIEDRKNQLLLIKAFTKLYKNRSDIKLIINSRRVDKKIYKEMMNYINKHNVNNIFITLKTLPKSKYNKLFGSIDCYVSLSKGEGFSIQPREAVARGIPTIVTNNTGQSDIVQSNLVYSIPSNIKLPAYYDILDSFVGYNYNANIDDVVKALKHVYDHYESYLSIAEESRNWAKQFHYSTLENRYVNLFESIGMRSNK